MSNTTRLATRRGPNIDRQHRLRAFASQRRFVVGRVELLNSGFPASTIESWLSSGLLVGLFRGVYSYGRDVETIESAWRAGLLVGGSGSALTGRSALEVWGAVRSAHSVPQLIVVATPADRGATHRGRSQALCRTRVKVVQRKIEPQDIRRKDGLALMRPSLALIEFSASATPKQVMFAFLETCRLRLFGKNEVSLAFQRAAGRRGATKLRPLLAMWVPELNRIKSVLEGKFLLAWIERGLVMPRVNVKVHGREVDCHWPHRGLILELDGGAFHTDPMARKRDAEKTRFLESRGLEVIRVTWKEFEADPDSVVDRIACRLEPAQTGSA